MKKLRFNWFLLIRLAGIALFFIVLARTNLAELWSWIKEIDVTHLVLAILFLSLGLIVKAWRWYILTETGFNLKNLIKRSGQFFEGYAFGVITPGRMGELMKAGHAGSRSGILGAGLRVIAERGMDLSIFIIIAGISISQNVMPGISTFLGWLILSCGFAGMILSLLILVSPSVVKMVEYLLRLIRVLGKDKNLEFIHRTSFNTLSFLVWSFVSNLSYFTCCYYLATGVGMDLSIIAVSGGVATAGVLNTIPITIMGLGTREVTFLYVFSDFPQAQIMAFSSLVFLLAQVGGGLVAMLLGQLFLWISKIKVQSSKTQ
jgi:uncharacterized membrane protein YbhN (UPF0104 family)